MVRTFTHEELSLFETQLGSQFFCTKRCVQPGLQSWSSIGFWSDTKSEFSGAESPDPDPQESQIFLLGIIKNTGIELKFRSIKINADQIQT